MILAIIGSRSFKNNKLLCDILDPHINLIKKVVSGGASGADRLGEEWAIKNNIETEIFIPNWQKYGKKAGFIRNDSIIEASTHVLAFWDGVSKGTNNSIGLAKKYNKKLKVIKFKPIIDKVIDNLGEYGE